MGGRTSVNAEEKLTFFVVIVAVITKMSFEVNPLPPWGTWLFRPDQYVLESPVSFHSCKSDIIGRSDSLHAVSRTTE
jgi:hypothetical protein